MGSWRIMLRNMSVLDEIFSSCITGDVSLGLLMKYDCKVACQCLIKQIWDIRRIHYSVYFGIKKYKYWAICKGAQYMLCLQYRSEGKSVIIHMNIIMEKVSTYHMTSSSLG